MDSLKNISRFAGIGYLVIFITGFFSNFFVLENLVIYSDATTTVNNIINSSFLYRMGIFSFIIMVIFDVLLAWAFYILLRPVNKDISLLSSWLRLVNATIFGIALYNLLSINQLISSADYLKAFPVGELHAKVILCLNTFNNTWLIGLIFFGIHLLVLGYLIVKSSYIPKIIGIFLLIAAAGYLIDSFANFLLSDYDNLKNIFLIIVLVPGIIGELSLTFWLLIKGVKEKSLVVKENE